MLDDNLEKKVNDKLLDDLQYYRKTLLFLGGNVPLEALCLPKVIQTILCSAGVDRVYDLIDRDLTKIKGLGRNRISLLASRIDEFFSINL